MFSRILASMVLALTLAAGAGAAADGDAARLQEALRLGDVFAVMSEEGRAYGAEIETDMFPGTGGPAWLGAVNGIYATDRILPIFSATFEAELTRSGADVAAMLAFFESGLGQRVTTLEISGRRALLEEAVEDASRLKYQELAAAGDAKLALVDEFVDANDLVEANVAGALNANYAFYQGLADGGVLKDDLSEQEIISEIWAQEQAIRDETEIWIRSYLAMAYAPLSEDEIRDYIAFSRTPAGTGLNVALFAGFDAVFTEVSRQLGRAAGGVLAGQDL